MRIGVSEHRVLRVPGRAGSASCVADLGAFRRDDRHDRSFNAKDPGCPMDALAPLATRGSGDAQDRGGLDFVAKSLNEMAARRKCNDASNSMPDRLED